MVDKTTFSLNSVDFSVPYASSKQLIIVNSDSPINKKEDIVDKKLGSQLSSTGFNYCLDNKYDVRPYDPVDAVLALTSNQIDAVIMDELPAKNMVAKSNGKIRVLDDYLFEEEYRIAFSKGNKELEKVINELIKELKLSGYISERIKEYSSYENLNPSFWDKIKMNLIEKDRWKQLLNGLCITFEIIKLFPLDSLLSSGLRVPLPIPAPVIAPKIPPAVPIAIAFIIGVKGMVNFEKKQCSFGLYLSC